MRYSLLLLFYCFFSALHAPAAPPFLLLRQSYALSVEPAEGTITTRSSVKIKHEGSQPRRNLTLYLSSICTVSGVTSDHGELKWTRSPSLIPYFANVGITFDRAIVPGETLSVTLSYRIERIIKNTGLAAMNMSLGPDYVYLFEGWTPSLEPLLDQQGFVNTVQKSSFSMDITVPAPFTALTIGTLKEKETTPSGTTYRYAYSGAPVFMIPVIAGRFHRRSFTSGPVPAELFTTAETPQSTAHPLYNFIAEVASFQADYLGCKRPERVRIVLVETGGLARGFPFMILLPPYYLSLWRSPGAQELIAHELSHTYFGNLVTAGGPGGNEFLSEGMATFMGVRTVGHFKGVEMERRLLEEKRDLYLSSENPNVPIIELLPMQNVLSGEAYKKGALLLNEMRRLLGKDRFRTLLRSYINRFKGTSVTLADFEAICRDVDEKQLPPLINQYLKTGDLPYVTINNFKCVKEEEKDAWRTTLTLVNTGPGFGYVPLLLEADHPAASTATKVEKKTVFVKGKSTKACFFITSFPVKQCVIDPDAVFLHGVKRKGRLKQAAELRQKGSYDEAEKVYKALLGILPGDGEVWYGLGRNHQAAGRAAEAIECFEQAARCGGTAWLPEWAWLRQADCLLKQGDSKRAHTFLRRILDRPNDTYNIKSKVRKRIKENNL